MISDKLLPPFIVGETYLDRDGEYKVIAVAGDKLTIERADGSRAVQDVSLKARILAVYWLISIKIPAGHP